MNGLHSVEGQTEDLKRNYGDDPWKLVVHGIDSELAGRDESIFALGNGYLGVRGAHEEGSPLGSHGTFINGLHETWRIEHAESAYGFAELGQTLVSVPDAKTTRIYVDDERLNLESSEILEITRELDLRAGTYTRAVLWLTPTGKRVKVVTRRLVSFVARHSATFETSITVLDADAELTVSTLLINRQDIGAARSKENKLAGQLDPRKSETLNDRVFVPGPSRHDAHRSVLSFRINSSGMTLGVGAHHRFEPGAPVVFDGANVEANGEHSFIEGAWHSRVEASADRTRRLYQGEAKMGQTVRLVKTVAYHSSRTAGLDEMLDRCVHTLEKVVGQPAQIRWEEQQDFLDAFWQRSDVVVDAEPGVQQAIRWNLFQVAQASARADGLGIAAKGVTGSGYSGHYFWDGEIYVMPFLTYTTPLWTRNALRSRERMLPIARRRAVTLNERGALFPWRTINGEEASAYYAAGTAAYHINADITYALARYVSASGDIEFLRGGASEIAVETARLWASLGFWRRDGEAWHFHIHGVTGPDEYTTVVNDNLFTNVMARQNLLFAAEIVGRLHSEDPEGYAALVERLALDADEAAEWVRAAEAMFIPYSENAGVHPQDAHFLEREVWDLAATPPEQKPLLLHFHPLVIYRFQVLKQADVVLALLLASNEFSAEEKRRNFEYYDALTTGDSTLSAVVQSIIAAEVGYRDLAYSYFDHALRVDLDDLHQNSADGVHIASTGGVWMMLAQGFAGMRDAGRRLCFDPRLPEHWATLSFKLAWCGRRVRVSVSQSSIEFEMIEGIVPMTISVRGKNYELTATAPLAVALDGQGPDLGVFTGLSAGMLPREGDIGVLPEKHLEVPVLTGQIPTLPPGG